MSRTVELSPQPVVLGLLMMGPRHPYELHQEFSRELGRVWRVGQSHLYAHLEQLAQAGLATVRLEEQANRPPRKVYSITAAGRKYFLEWLHQPCQHVRHMRLEFLARLYFFCRLSLPGGAQLVAEQKAILQAMVKSLKRAIAQSDDDYWRLVLEFRRHEMQAIIRWLDILPFDK